MVFLLRVPTVWLSGVVIAVVLLLLRVEIGLGTALAGAALTVVAAVRIESILDRRRGVGRRRLFRGARLSPRRVAALVVALGLVASTSSALAMRLVTSIHRQIDDEIRVRTQPNVKRGYY